jgi:hypothetical protein
MVARCAVLLSIAGTLIVWVQSLSISSSSSSSSSKRRGRQGLHSSHDTDGLLLVEEQPHANLLILGLGRVGWHVAQQAASTTAKSATSAVTLTSPLVPEDHALDVLDSTATSRLFGRIFGTVRRETQITLKVDDSKDAATVPITVLSWNATADILQAAQTCSHLLVTIPPPPAMVKDETKGETTPETATESLLYTQILETMMLRSASPCWIGILSTTGVYGNHNGHWVTEESPCLVDKDSSAYRYLDHEESWKRRVMDCTTVAAAAAATANGSGCSPLVATKRNTGCGLRIFRCAGIYGPSQSALHTVYKNKQAYSAPRIRASTSSSSSSNNTTAAADATSLGTLGSTTATATNESRDVTNRIHVTDLAAAIVASMQQHCDDSSDSTSTSTLEYYNLADDEPESRRVVMNHAAMLLQGIGVLDVVDQESLFDRHNDRPNAASARRRTVDAKRVSNAKMRHDLLPTLYYPTYRQGLAAILHHQPNPWHDDLPT